MVPQIVATLGLGLDIVGALWIVKSLVALRDDEVATATGPLPATWDGVEASSPRPALGRILRESRRDARAGGIVLAAGFALQLVAVWLR